MRILHVFDFFMPRGGGTVDLLYKLAKAQAQKGHEVAIFTSDFELDRAYIDSLPEVKVHTFRCLSSLGGFYFTPGIIGGIRGRLKDFDIVHLHCFRSFQNIVLHHYARKYGVPYVLDTHGSLPRTHGKVVFKGLLKWLYDIAFGYRILKDADICIAETEVGVKEYEKFGVSQNRIAVIAPPLDTKEFANLPARGLFRNKYNIQAKHIVTFLGRINWIKGLAFLVESFAELLKVRNDVILVMVGNDDGYQATLENLISKLGIADKVLFTGFLGGEAKLAALADASMVIQTSVYEQGVRVPFEAIMCNTPVIVAGHTGPGEIIGKTDTGYLVEYGNNSELRDMIQYIMNNPAEAAVKTKRAREYIIANYSLENGIEKYDGLYRNVTGKGVK
jgi:glycosyltransferase involved in cell wall biosynthesis